MDNLWPTSYETSLPRKITLQNSVSKQRPVLFFEPGCVQNWVVRRMEGNGNSSLFDWLNITRVRCVDNSSPNGGRYFCILSLLPCNEIQKRGTEKNSRRVLSSSLKRERERNWKYSRKEFGGRIINFRNNRNSAFSPPFPFFSPSPRSSSNSSSSLSLSLSLCLKSNGRSGILYPLSRWLMQSCMSAVIIVKS